MFKNTSDIPVGFIGAQKQTTTIQSDLAERLLGYVDQKVEAHISVFQRDLFEQVCLTNTHTHTRM